MSTCVDHGWNFEYFAANRTHETTLHFFVHSRGVFFQIERVQGVPPLHSQSGMATHLLSRYEREYIVSGVNEDLRADGRTCRDFRDFSLESGVVSNTSGSARIRLVSCNYSQYEGYCRYNALILLLAGSD